MRIQAPTYTQTPNDLFDHWLPHLSESELKVLLVILRKTFGWHKKRDKISISQLARFTGMMEETVIKATKSLQNKGVIHKEVIGPKGKQETYYELVVNEDSNNSYPSVEPRTPLGFDGGGSTEAQKKASSLKETAAKEKENAADSSERISKQTSKEFNDSFIPLDCLYDTKIPKADMREIQSMYPPHVIEHAVSYAKHPLVKIKTTLVQTIKWACQFEPAFPVEVKNQTPLDKIKAIFKNREFYNGAECFITEDCIAFQRGMKHMQIKLDKFFIWDNLLILCDNFQIQLPKNL